MGLFDFLKKKKDDGPVRYSSVSKYLNGGNLPSDMKTLYDIGRYHMEENTRNAQSYFGAVEAFEKLCELDKNYEYPLARKWLGQCYIDGKGVPTDTDKGIKFYDEWMKHFLLTETELLKIDDELRDYFSQGFHNYAFLLDCADLRVQQEKDKNEYPIGKCLYEIFLPIWLYGNVSKEMDFYRYSIHKYLRFAADNFGDKMVGYFAEDFSGELSVVSKTYESYIEAGNIFAQERYLQFCRKKGMKPSQEILDSRNQIWGKMARLQQSHDHEARFARREEIDIKFAKVKDFFLGPDYSFDISYPFEYTENSVYYLRKKAEYNSKRVTSGWSSYKMESEIFRYARALLEMEYAPAYFIYAKLYAKNYKDPKMPKASTVWFFEKAKELGYPPAVNLERECDVDTMDLARALGFEKALKAYRDHLQESLKPYKKSPLEEFLEYYEKGKYIYCLSIVHSGFKLPAQIDLKELLHNATKEAVDWVGFDGHGYRVTKAYNSDGEKDHIAGSDYVIRMLEMLSSYKEPMADFLLGICYESLISKNRPDQTRLWVARAYHGFNRAAERKNFSYLYYGPIPDELWEKFEYRIREVSICHRIFNDHSIKDASITDKFKKR